MADERELIGSIRARPQEDAPRLAYADWLEERGDPRGEFIRIQIWLHQRQFAGKTDAGLSGEAEIERLQHRQDELLAAHRDQWIAPLQALGAIEDKYMLRGTIRFQRGFVNELKIDAVDFLQNADELFVIDPGLQRVWLTNVKKVIEPLADSSALAQLDGLDLSYNHLGPGGLRRLLRAPLTDRLQSIVLYRNDLQSAGLRYLCSMPWSHLEEFDFSSNDIGEVGLELVAGCEQFSNLQSLNWWGNPTTPDAVAQLANSAFVRNLRKLRLANCLVGQNERIGLSSNESLIKLESLNLGGNRLNDNCLREILLRAKLRQLQSLDLCGCLCENSTWRIFALRGINMRLRKLSLRWARMKDRGIANLAKAKCLEDLTHLDLGACGVTNKGVAKLAASPVFRHLICLDLSRNDLHDVGVYSLIKSSTLSSLRRLRLSAQGLSKDAIAALQDRFGAGLRLDA